MENEKIYSDLESLLIDLHNSINKDCHIVTIDLSNEFSTITLSNYPLRSRDIEFLPFFFPRFKMLVQKVYRQNTKLCKHPIIIYLVWRFIENKQKFCFEWPFGYDELEQFLTSMNHSIPNNVSFA